MKRPYLCFPTCSSVCPGCLDLHATTCGPMARPKAPTKRPYRVCCSGFLECLRCGAVPIPLYCLCLLARAMPLWNYYFSMLHRSPFPTLRGLRTAVVPMLRPSSHWLQWTSQLPRCVGDSPLSRGCGSCIHYLDVSPRLCISSCVESTTSCQP